MYKPTTSTVCTEISTKKSRAIQPCAQNAGISMQKQLLRAFAKKASVLYRQEYNWALYTACRKSEAVPHEDTLHNWNAQSRVSQALHNIKLGPNYYPDGFSGVGI